MGRIKLDLHGIYNKGRAIDSQLKRLIYEAVKKVILLLDKPAKSVILTQ